MIHTSPFHTKLASPWTCPAAGKARLLQRLYHSLLIACVLCLGSKVGFATEIRRFALVIGTNDGGTGRTILRYAQRDAELVANVLSRLGGVAHADLLLLREATPSALEQGFAQIRELMRQAHQAGQRTELIFYYSGHSDESGLLIQGDHVDYMKLRRAIESLPAAVHVAVLDSCASGALSLAKGGLRGPPFLQDLSSNVHGSAFVASASATEAAQESERLKGSFFTHHWVAGLRGAADTNRDQRVTLNEAYQYAFDQTLAQTENTRAGAQHPHYDMRLVGSGSLVLSDLRGNTALMLFAPELEGRAYVRDERGNLVVEVQKQPGRPLGLALDPGSYQVRLAYRDRLLVGTFEVTPRGPAHVGPKQLADTEALEFAERGPISEWQPTHLLSASYTGLSGHELTENAYHPSYVMLPSGYRLSGQFEQRYQHGAELRYLHRIGPVFVGGTAGYRHGTYRFDGSDLLYNQPLRYQEKAKSHDFYGLASMEWHMPLWRWIRPYRIWRWIRPMIGIDAGAGFIAQHKETLSLNPTDTSAELVLSDSQNWDRWLPAFHGRARSSFTSALISQSIQSESDLDGRGRIGSR